jgi:Fic-DOC domain mobile mystery protein B
LPSSPFRTKNADNTPLEDDEIEGIIPGHIQTRSHLNEWEALNIARAHEWLATRRSETGVLDVSFLRELHRQMFGATWKWAGTFRRSDRNISPHNWSQVPGLMGDLVRNAAAQYDASNQTLQEIDAIAVRFHHALVLIHPWPNGNGRHARLATDLLLEEWSRPAFTWGGGGDLNAIGAAREVYVRALQKADAGDFAPLAGFVRS